MSEKQLIRIVVTGGPCGGKTEAMKRIKSRFTEEGYVVIFVPETATELITGGIAPWTCETNLKYQLCQMQLQLYKEEIYSQGSMWQKGDKVLMVYDRGLMDNKCYMTDEEYSQLLKEMNLTEEALTSHYDAVFHLETAAKNNQQAYTLENNGARTESVEEAIQLDNRGLESWSIHPEFHVIHGQEEFEDKMQQVVDEISAFLLRFEGK